MREPAFWDRAWSAFDPKRGFDCADRPDPDGDRIIAALRERALRRVCDAGCGCGVRALRLARQGFEVSGFDLSERAAALAGALLLEHGFPARFRAADIRSTGYADGAFDAVVCRDVIDHLPIRDGRAAVGELLRIVRPGGRVLLTLDKSDGEYEAKPHSVNADGDYCYTGGKWAGMVFHPWTPEELAALEGVEARRETDTGFFLVLNKTTDTEGGTDDAAAGGI